MVPNKFNVVHFSGFDLASQYGEALPGIYDKIVDANWNCVYIMCFGLKFAGFDIAPQYMTPEMFSDHIMLNGIISIGRNDVITIPSIIPPPTPPVIQPLTVTENRVYEVPSGVDGFNPVTGQVPIPVPKYEEVQPDFFGLATAYQALNGSFYTNLDSNQCLFLAEIEAGEKYVVFLPETVSTRFRAAKWPGKSFSDFEPYLDTPGTNVEVYSGGTMITSTDELSGDGLTRRFFFDGVDGEVVIGTSSVSALIRPILLKVN